MRAHLWLVLVAATGCTATVTDRGSGTSGASSSATGGTAGSTGGSSASTSGTASASSSGSTTTGAGSTGGTTGATTGGLHLGASIDALVGINGFIDDPWNQLTPFGTVREYHNWSWNDGNGDGSYSGYPDSQLSFSLWGGYWDFDAYYATLADAGVTAFPCVEGSAAYYGNDMPPATPSSDTTAAASYAAHADFMFQLAARYGSRPVADEKLELASGQVRASGLNVLHYFENGNEPDNNWTHSDHSYLITPAEFAAQTSADDDGDQGRLGDTFGIKNADPNAKLVLGGLAMAGDADSVTNAKAYLDGMRAWASAHRGGDFPADVVNVHAYCFGATASDPGVAPEPCGLGDAMAQMVAYRDQNLPGKELWITEFGYDTDPGSHLRAPAIGSSSAEVVQGQWLVRSVLVLAEAGVDRATIFVSRDGCTGSACATPSQQFTTSGVFTDGASGYVPKTAWYFLATFRHALAGLRFAGTRATGRGDVRVDAFADASGRGAYVVWAPTSTGATVSGFSLSVPGATSASSVQLVDHGTTGQASALAITGGAISLQVTETPRIVLVDRVQ